MMVGTLRADAKPGSRAYWHPAPNEPERTARGAPLFAHGEVEIQGGTVVSFDARTGNFSLRTDRRDFGGGDVVSVEGDRVFASEHDAVIAALMVARRIEDESDAAVEAAAKTRDAARAAARQIVRSFRLYDGRRPPDDSY